VLKSKLEDNLKEKNEVIVKAYQGREYAFDDVYREYLEYGRALKPFITDTALFLNRAMDQGKSVLFEGAQGAFLDIDFGTYPFVTSSNCIVGGACAGTGVAPMRINSALAVVKAYTTRVGEGPFPTEFSAEFHERFRQKGNEFGATTGRPRRCGWFDSVLVKYSVTINGVKEIAIMKLDVLDNLETIKVCTAYKYKGKILTDFPSDSDVLKNAKPVYEELPGWTSLSQGLDNYDKLPENAKAYIKKIEEILDVRVKYISTGSKRSEIIIR
jgi:adenylosuccinate synthase